MGHFTFVNRIASLLNDGGRLVSLASSGHRFSNVDLEDPNFDRGDYEPWTAYGRAKTANILFAVEFDRRHKDRGIRAAALHPGGIHTELARHLDDGALKALVERINAAAQEAGGEAFEFKSIPQGAATSVWAATVADPAEIGGRYLEDCHVAKLAENEGLREGVRAYAIDPGNAKALWAKSEEMVGERF